MQTPATETETERRAERLDEVVQLIRAKVAADAADTLAGFVQRYFGHVDPEDLAERPVADLYGAALSHWSFARKREPGRARVRAFNPTIAEHGWQSTHTVIEIVNDDMPFLVDSTTTEINRQGLTLHLIEHPIFAVERGADGSLGAVWPRNEAPAAARESWMHIEIDRLVDPQQRTELVAGIERVLGNVRAAVEDWKPMVARLQDRKSTRLNSSHRH